MVEVVTGRADPDPLLEDRKWPHRLSFSSLISTSSVLVAAFLVVRLHSLQFLLAFIHSLTRDPLTREQTESDSQARVALTTHDSTIPENRFRPFNAIRAMAIGNPESDERLGKLVALEGDSEIISTQLRLLPPSSKILIIPTILEDLPQPAKDVSFNARAFVRDVHQASGKRTAIARSFLAQSTSKHPRMVFMNGGSVSAQAICITKICENITNGEHLEAAAVFNDIIKDGVEGLMRDEDPTEEVALASPNGNYVKPSVEDEDDNSQQPIDIDGQTLNEEPTLKAMEAAESLDQETASLHPPNTISLVEDQNAVALTEENVDQFSEQHNISSTTTTTEDIFTSPSGDTIVRSMITVSARRSIFGPRLTAPNNQISIISHQDIEDDDYVDALRSPGDESMFSGVSAPTTPHNVTFGEACIVDVHSATPEKKLRQVTSVDRFFPSNSRIQEPIFGPRSLRHAVSSNYLSVKPATFGGRRSSLSDYETMPRTTFMRASETTIRRSPTWGSGSVRSFSSSSPVPRFFVDRGTDPGEYTVTASENNSPPSEPVFSIVEDFVIHFTDGSDNEIFDSVLRCYRDGSLPLSSSSCASNASISDDHTETGAEATLETLDPRTSDRDDFDPYRPLSPADSTFPSPPQRLWPSKHQMEQSDSNRNYEPPTPSLTPPPSTNGSFQRFQEFVADSKSTIDVQNSLRAILKMHVPTSDGFTQHYHSIIPEADRLWKPVFISENSVGNKSEGTTVDQILALGREDGVSRDFFSEVSGQVEKLGTKKSGASRSGTLDLRYLIANAIESFAAHHISSLDPMSDPNLLATLVVPHLESYLATNSTRFLIIHYSSSQLPIILALQNLLGSTLFRIAGILDSLSSDPPPFSFGCARSPLTSPIHSKFSTQVQQVRSNSTAKRGPIITKRKSTSSTSASFAKANYLIPSTATDAEITTFLSSIWKVLIERDNFYRPEPEQSVPEPAIKTTIVNTKPIPIPPVQTIKSNLPKTPPQTPSKASYLSAPYQEPARTHHKHTTSRDSTTRPSRTSTAKQTSASSIKSAKTTASERVRKDDARERQSEKDWANFYIDEEDSEDDEYDRMVLGRAGVAPGKLQYGANKNAKALAIMMESGKKRPANSKKALKWLGLA